MSVFRQNYLPYCIYPVTEPKAFVQVEWVVLNRHYKPLGEDPSKWYVYEDLPLRITRLDKQTLRRISHHGASKPLILGEPIFLYDDGCIPDFSEHRRAYLQRLFALNSGKVIRRGDDLAGGFRPATRR